MRFFIAYITGVISTIFCFAAVLEFDAFTSTLYLCAAFSIVFFGKTLDYRYKEKRRDEYYKKYSFKRKSCNEDKE